jgi:bifunctional DNase/RNase
MAVQSRQKRGVISLHGGRRSACIGVAPDRTIPHEKPAAKGVRFMIESVVESIRVSLVTNQRVVILKELEGERYLPIWIGHFEAEAIAMELQGVEAARPLPYDIMKKIIADLGGRVRRVLISGLREDVFYATIVLEAAGRQIEVDSRSSDAIALAVRTKVPIFVDETVMEKAGVLFGDDEEEAEAEAKPKPTVDDEKLTSFRNFINSLDFSDENKEGN